MTLVKELWSEVPEASSPPAPDQRRQMLERLVTRCTEAYYAGT